MWGLTKTMHLTEVLTNRISLSTDLVAYLETFQIHIDCFLGKSWRNHFFISMDIDQFSAKYITIWMPPPRSRLDYQSMGGRDSSTSTPVCSLRAQFWWLFIGVKTTHWPREGIWSSNLWPWCTSQMGNRVKRDRGPEPRQGDVGIRFSAAQFTVLVCFVTKLLHRSEDLISYSWDEPFVFVYIS